LRRRSQFYRNVIDRQTGYAQGRYADGSFLKENNAFQFCDFITEGYPSHYTWYVPHDVYGLMECMGGKDKFVSKLDSMFSMGYYWHGNEPCHQVAFLYNYAGQPWKTQKEVRQIMEHEYHLGANGLSGNDDAGQMSAWYIFAAMGFYPVCPGSSYYILASPSFDKVTIQLEDGKSFVIKAQNASADNVYVQSVLFNGVPYSKNYLLHSDIAAGGELEFVMGNEPNLEWGSSLDDCPPDLFLELR
jgi:predicted alpha-1,2-mannosidase